MDVCNISPQMLWLGGKSDDRGEQKTRKGGKEVGDICPGQQKDVNEKREVVGTESLYYTVRA